MREGGAEVIQLEGEGPQHRLLLGPARQVPGFLGDGEHVLGVAAPHVVELTAFDDAFVGELTDGLEHRGALVVAADQVGVREREHIPVVRSADDLGGVARPAPAKDGQARQQLLLRLVEQVVAPCDRRVQRPLPSRCVAAARQ